MSTEPNQRDRELATEWVRKMVTDPEIRSYEEVLQPLIATYRADSERAMALRVAEAKLERSKQFADKVERYLSRDATNMEIHLSIEELLESDRAAVLALGGKL